MESKRLRLGHAWVLMGDEHVNSPREDIEVSVWWFAVDEHDLDVWVSCAEGR